MVLSPDQCRAARALLDWSQDELAGRAKVAKKSIADFERGAQIPYEKTLRELALAFEAAGIELIAENGGGPGVRKKHATAKLARMRVSRFDRIASLAITYRGKNYRIRLSTDVLDDIDRTNHKTEAALENAANAHLNLILVRSAAAIDAGRANVDGDLLLTAGEDFPETG